MLAAAEKLKEPCKEVGVHLSIAKTSDPGNTGVSLDVVKLKTQTHASDHFRVAAVFGEHSRELISPETGLLAIKALCNKMPKCTSCEDDHSTQLSSLLERGEKVRRVPSEWEIVLNGNPRTRERLEQSGNFCLRRDPADVDLNRNWNDHFTGGDDHGNAPFSEPETRAYRAELERQRPNAYFSVHSGELGLYAPHAWTFAEPTSPSEEAALPEYGVLRKVQKELCPECPAGSAARLQGMVITGSSFDYVRDELKSNYSYAFELYKDASSSPVTPDGCFQYFNPPTPDKFMTVGAKFANVMLESAYLSMVHSNDTAAAPESLAEGIF